MAGRKPKRPPDWAAIEAEYLAGGVTYKHLAVKHGVSERTVERHASAGDWEARRREVVGRVSGELPGRVADALADEAARGAVMSAREVLEELTRIARGGMQAIASWGAGGLVLKDSAALSPDEVATVAEVTETRSETGGSLRIKQYDKLAALDKLARHYGLYAEKGGDPSASTQGAKPVPVSPEMDAAELARLYREALKGPQPHQ